MNTFKGRFYSIFIISYYTGFVVLGIALLMVLPILTAVALQEWNPFWDFVITMAISVILGLLLIIIGKQTRLNKSFVQWKHGFVVASLSWIILMFLCAIPYLLSGHVNSLLDACFDVMSGFTTTGMVLTQDLDHISLSLNMWRHMLTFIGGQGMVVLALTFLLKETGGAYIFYVGEAKDIDLVPNVKGTARIIWKISMVYLLIGTAALWIDGMTIGLTPLSAFFNGLFIFASSWSTGGFAPYTQNMMYYHSFSYESLTIIFFILGSLNFGLHYAILSGNKKELIKNIETQSFFITSFLASVLAVLWLARTGVYNDAIAIFRRVVYNVLSAHTTTGFGSVYARQFALEWGDFGILILVIVMLIGGSACSTAGGFKGLRVGIIFKSILADVKRLLASERKVKVFRFHHIKDQILADGLVKASGLIIICYLITFAIGTLIGTFCGYPLASAAFESASITGNVGLSIGITATGMPAVMKVYYIIAMYLGRLEFLSVFALIGFIIGGIKKCWTK
ncbi:TrkH family potassium uptake protein [Acetobacterium sp.]|jgi:trk system potassium uptake protein TrkH|uniref:TrkH family potassium uptake protein n=1 Tax=Acetobacterium sp. TaxID=1872094 RepID=UPI000CBF74C1|nr:potassium transporter TrkG [Acetobacterium sp.]MDO9492399.1 potassium transporter TrkG [Acetobacterium sp.]PKM71999.1 MAG: cation transporter [Firmicutes bacterium HGW-Firmicutes-17]